MLSEKVMRAYLAIHRLITLSRMGAVRSVTPYHRRDERPDRRRRSVDRARVDGHGVAVQTGRQVVEEGAVLGKLPVPRFTPPPGRGARR